MVFQILVIKWFCCLIQLMVVVIFMVLIERKVLGYMAMRKGPNKVSVGGLFQSLADALKLGLKETDPNQTSNKKFFLYGPIGSLLMILGSWLNIVVNFNSFVFQYGVVVLFCLMSFHIYVLLVVSWGGNSKYGLLGGLRASAQVMSYEISFFFLLFCLVYLFMTFNMKTFFSNYLQKFWLFFVLLGCWLMTCLAETKRSPFDFAEGESELVSGFKVEYGALQFSFLYLGEYGSIMLLSTLTVFLFVKKKVWFSFFLVKFMIVFFIWVRGSLPRFRYDLLMTYVWVGMLPLMLVVLSFLVLF